MQLSDELRAEILQHAKAETPKSVAAWSLWLRDGIGTFRARTLQNP